MSGLKRKSEAELMLDATLLVLTGGLIGWAFANSAGTGVVSAAVGYIVTRYKGVISR